MRANRAMKRACQRPGRTHVVRIINLNDIALTHLRAPFAPCSRHDGFKSIFLFLLKRRMVKRGVLGRTPAAFPVFRRGRAVINRCLKWATPRRGYRVQRTCFF
jgi:hypothetical protein